jgi:hypothetical protein
MHPADLADLDLDPVLSSEDIFCPVVDGWSDEKWQFCLTQWRNITGTLDGRFVFEQEHGSPTECSGMYNQDESFYWPIPYSASPTLFVYDLFTHEDTLSVMRETRSFCDDDEEIHCWLSGKE